MKKNVGQLDKIARIVIGALLIALTLMGTIGLWGWIGVVLLATGLLSFCPGYSLFSFSTCSRDPSCDASTARGFMSMVT